MRMTSRNLVSNGETRGGEHDGASAVDEKGITRQQLGRVARLIRDVQLACVMRH